MFLRFGAEPEAIFRAVIEVGRVEVLTEPAVQVRDLGALFRAQRAPSVRQIREHAAGLVLMLEAHPLDGDASRKRRGHGPAKVSRVALSA